MKTGSWFSMRVHLVCWLHHLYAAEGFELRGSERSATPDAVEFLPLSNPRRPTELEEAYLDSFSILKYETGAASFMGPICDRRAKRADEADSTEAP